MNIGASCSVSSSGCMRSSAPSAATSQIGSAGASPSAASLFVWSAVTWWTGQVDSYSELLWARSLMGMSEAFYIPAALALIADYHAGPTRSRAVGLHQIAIYFGVIAGGFGGYAAADPNLGWRLTFTACGVFGMLYALPLTSLLRDPPRSPARLSASATSPLGAMQGIVRQLLLLSCWSCISRCRRWRVGWCATGCPPS